LRKRSIQEHIFLLIALLLFSYLLWLSGISREPVLIILEFAAILSTALIFGGMMKRLHQPAVVGEILGGIALGPTVFGTIAPAMQSRIFPAFGESAEVLRAAGSLGLIAFIFIAGLQVDLTSIKQRSRSAILTSISGIVLPFATGFGIVVLMPDIWGVSSEGLVIFALFMGTVLSISALPVIARILMDIDLLKTELGAMIITAATIDDMIGWLLFARILSSISSGSSAGLNLGIISSFLGLAAFMIYLMNKNAAKLLFGLKDELIEIIAVVVLAASILCEFIGANGIFGAFLAGVLLSQRFERREQILSRACYPVMGILASIYFVSIGLKTDFIANFDPKVVLLIFIVACIGKVVGASLGAKAGGASMRDSLAIGFGLNARGAMEIILASVALDCGLIDRRIFVALIVMALATTIVCGSMIQRLIMTSKVSDEERRTEKSTAPY